QCRVQIVQRRTACNFTLKYWESIDFGPDRCVSIYIGGSNEDLFSITIFQLDNLGTIIGKANVQLVGRISRVIHGFDNSIHGGASVEVRFRIIAVCGSEKLPVSVFDYVYPGASAVVVHHFMKRSARY